MFLERLLYNPFFALAFLIAFFLVLFSGAVYLAYKLHRKYYMSRSDLRLLVDGECYTPEQIRAAFRKTFASQMGPKVTAACNAFLRSLCDASIR